MDGAGSQELAAPSQDHDLRLRLMLAFSSPEHERRFVDHYVAFYFRFAQASLVLGLLLVFGDFLVDHFSHAPVHANYLRLELCLPVLAAGLAYSFMPAARRHWQPAMAGFIVAVAACLFWILLLIDAEGGAGLKTWVGILNFTFLEFYCFVILGVQFRYALFAGLTILGAFEAALGERAGLSAGELAYWSYHVVTLFILSAGIGWWREYLLRKEFSVRTSLEESRELAEHLARAKGDLLATMGHEIRTPMNGVVGMAEVLLNGPLPEHLVDQVSTIRSSAFALLGIIDDLLDFSKIEAGRLELERVVVDLPALIEGACATLLPIAVAKDVELSLFISPRLPAQIWSDPTRLRQVLFNLASNAIKFSAGEPTRRGRVSIRVDLAPDASPGMVLSVSDNGIGMDAVAQARLFQPFTQAESSTTRRFGGTGLGLTITKRLTTLMEGRIDVHSSPGNGSTFTVTLPLRAASRGSEGIGVDLAGVLCVLVGRGETIDDMRAYLEHAGARVQAATDSAIALELARGVDAPVVIQASWRDTQSLALLRGAFEPVPSVRHVLVARGPQRVFEPGLDVTVVDGNCLRRSELLHAVAIASGRAARREAQQIEGGDRQNAAANVLPLDEARRLGRLILVAEDDEVNQKVIRQQIHMLGYAAAIVDNGAEALRLWRDGGYALLLTDLHMPEMDGYGLAQAIRSHEAESRVETEDRIPILALTANARQSEAIRARAAGMDEYLTKPMPLGALKAALRKWLPLDRPDTRPAELLEES
jgi:signal transduction histidine kinase/CheY-like chemotaxis protein